MTRHEHWNNFPGKGETSGVRRTAAALLITFALAPVRSLAATPAVVPCPVRTDAVIANTGEIVSSEHSLVDSYNSTLGAYGGTNLGSKGTVRAAGPIVRRGVIKGSIIEHSPSMLPEIPVSPIARPLPLGARVPGHLKLGGNQILTLKPGDYVAAGIDLDWPAEIRVAPIGHVRIFVTGRLSIGGGMNLHGRTEDLELIVTRERDAAPRADNDPLLSFLHRLFRFLFPNPHDVEIGRQGSLTGLLYAPKSEVYVDSDVFGTVVGATVTLERHAAVHYDVNLVCPTASLTSTATPPPTLPAPPPPVVGCYMNTRNGWQNIPCATPADLADFPKPQVTDVQLTVTGLNTIPLAFGQIDVTIPQISTITDVLTGSPSTANAFSLQSTTNQFPVPAREAIASGEYAGVVQFTIQSNGKNSAICIWNIGVLQQHYNPTCLTLCRPSRALYVCR